MDRINTANMAAGRKFQDANPSIGQEATYQNAEWHNGVQEELVAGLIERSGRTPTAGTYDQVFKSIIDLVHPVGSYYFTEDDTNSPNVLWNWQTWTEVKGVVLVGRDTAQPEFDTTGHTAGEKAHTLTQAELPNVQIELSTLPPWHGGTGGAGAGPYKDPTDMNTDAGLEKTAPLGDGDAHNNLQPYRVVRMWRRAS